MFNRKHVCNTLFYALHTQEKKTFIFAPPNKTFFKEYYESKIICLIKYIKASFLQGKCLQEKRYFLWCTL
jgi:hypothetical protein